MTLCQWPECDCPRDESLSGDQIIRRLAKCYVGETVKREGLEELARNTRDPQSLSAQTIAEMRHLKVGPFGAFA